MEFIEAVKQAGVVGAGGAGFPTCVKLNAKAEYLIINAAECEPLIETDKFLCRTFAERIVSTVDRMGEHLEAKHKVIALKAHYRREIEALKGAIEKLGSSTVIFPMRTYYPAGDEQIMVQAVTGRSVPERGLPLNVGCVVDNVGTVLSIADALEGTPVSLKYLSVTGQVDRKLIYRVPLGTPVRTVLRDAGCRDGRYSLILGGPMMGKILREEADIDKAVVTKTTGNLLVLPKDHYLIRHSQLSVQRMMHEAASACIQCRACTDLCPREATGHDVKPHLTMRNVWRNAQITDNAEFERIFGHAANCSSCGACELFSCPMGLSPRRMNDYVKGLLRERGINPAKNQEPKAKSYIEDRRIPTERLIARLGLTSYVSDELPELKSLETGEVTVPMAQHIGKPALPAVKEGDSVRAGDLIGQAQEGLSCPVHTGFGGIVKEIGPQGIRIVKKEA